MVGCSDPSMNVPDTHCTSCKILTLSKDSWKILVNGSESGGKLKSTSDALTFVLPTGGEIVYTCLANAQLLTLMETTGNTCQQTEKYNRIN